MVVVRTWTLSRAKAEFDQVLEEAKTKGPQEIRDNDGSFTVVFKPLRAGESVTNFLSKGLPDD